MYIQAKYLASLLVLSLIAFSTHAIAGLTCNLSSGTACSLKHDRGVGNFLHTSHLWTAGSGGSVRSEFTFTTESTVFYRTCTTTMPVAVSVDYSRVIVFDNRDSVVIICPPSQIVTYQF